MNTDRPFTLNRLVHLLGVLVVLAALVWLLYYLSAALVPFFIALLLAYIMDPWVSRVQRLVKNRAAAVMLTLFVVVAVVAGFFMITGPMVAREVQHFARLMAEQLPGWIHLAQDTPWIQELLKQASAIDVEQYLTGENLMNVAKKTLPGFWQGLSSVFGWLLGLVGVFTTLIYLIFILIDEEDMKANWHTWIPPKYRDRVSGVVEDVERSMNLYFRGQLKIALILSVIYIIGFSIVGLPMALVLGLVAGMLSLIPYFALLSVLPVMLSAGLLALDQGGSFWPPMIGALIVYAIAQGLEGLVLTPRIQGKNTGLRPEYILLALSVWGSLLGVVGMIIALPLTTVILSYYKRSVLGEVDQPLRTPASVVPVTAAKDPGPST
jgi:predicted PurR-regulated permease PerM